LHFDMVIDLQQLPRCRMMSLLSRADVRISFPSTPLVHWRYTHLIPPKEGYASQTKVSLLEPLGIHWNGEAPVIRLLNEEKTRAAHLLALCGYTKNQRLIAVDSTHRRASKRWPREYFAETIRILHDSDRNFRFLLLRGPGEDTDIHALQKLCIDKGIPERSLLIPEPLPDIRLSAACIAMADLLIGCCSSPRHIAAAVGTPSLVIPGASGTAWRLPSPLHQELRPALTCQPCSKTDCSDPQCLLQISPQKAAHKAKEMLAATPELHRQELL
jgi:ADP-heptose:LPS heptosyltransferase